MDKKQQLDRLRGRIIIDVFIKRREEPEERKKGNYSSFPSFLSLSSGRKITWRES
jgi:hypothetical protein